MERDRQHDSRPLAMHEVDVAPFCGTDFPPEPSEGSDDPPWIGVPGQLPHPYTVASTKSRIRRSNGTSYPMDRRTSRFPAIASRRFFSSSSNVEAWATQPGRSLTSATYVPVSSTSTLTVKGIFLSMVAVPLQYFGLIEKGRAMSVNPARTSSTRRPRSHSSLGTDVRS